MFSFKNGDVKKYKVKSLIKKIFTVDVKLRVTAANILEDPWFKIDT